MFFRPCSGSSLLQTLQAVLDANEWPSVSQLAEITAATETQAQSEPSIEELPGNASIHDMVPAIQSRVEQLCLDDDIAEADGEEEDESCQPPLIPYTMDAASRAPSLREELDWEVLTNPDTWDIVSEDSFEC